MFVSSQENAGTRGPPHSKTQFSEIESSDPKHRGGGNKDDIPGDGPWGSKSSKIKIAGVAFTLPRADLPYLPGHCPPNPKLLPPGGNSPKRRQEPF